MSNKYMFGVENYIGESLQPLSDEESVEKHLQSGEKNIEKYLQSLPKLKWGGGKEFLSLPRDSEEIIHVGKSCIILKVPKTDLVARIIGYGQNIKEHPDHYSLWGFDKTEQINSTTACLEEMGFKNIIKMHPYKTKIIARVIDGKVVYDAKPNIVYLSPDLTRNGRNKLLAATEENILPLRNGRHLLNEYKKSFNRILNAIEKEKIYQATASAHGYLEKNGEIRYDEAINHMFLLEKSKDNTGKLHLGDLNHLFLNKEVSPAKHRAPTKDLILPTIHLQLQLQY